MRTKDLSPTLIAREDNRDKLRFTRRGKGVMLGLAAGALTASIGVLAASGEDSPSAQTPEALKVGESTGTATVKIGGSESGWTQGAAVSAIKEASVYAVTGALYEVDAPMGTDVLELVDNLETYDNASRVVDMATHNGDIIPDEGDELTVTIEAKANSDGTIKSYDIVNAEIKDIPNNQN